MQHGDAIRGMVSEKYLLNELTPEVREEFEEHFFGCPECALEVRAGASFLEHSKTVLGTSFGSPVLAVPSVRHGGWRAWLRPAILVPAMALLLVVIGYQNFVTFSKMKTSADLKTPMILPSAALVSVRGDRLPIVRVHPKQPFLLFVDVPAEDRFGSYSCDLFSPDGKLEWSVPISAEAAKDTIPLQVPAGTETAGAHTLVVRGITSSGSSAVVARYSFEVQLPK